MKKDKTWLKNELKEMAHESRNYESWFYKFDKVLNLIDQLEEPEIPKDYEVLSEDWIQKQDTYVDAISECICANIEIDDLKRLLVPKQELEKIKIPRYVADWIEDNKEHFKEKHKLISMFLSSTKHSKYTQDCYKWSRVKGNMDKFMAALVNGYEVEKEESTPSKSGELERVVIPKYVANLIKESSTSNILTIINDFTLDDDLREFIEEYPKEFMRAWLDGYEVEPPKVYRFECLAHEEWDIRADSLDEAQKEADSEFCRRFPQMFGGAEFMKVVE